MRFNFGENWKSYIQSLTPEKIDISKVAIATSFGCTEFTGQLVLDIGSGSGLSSLAFVKMGAQVTAFDYDSHSVQCTDTLLSTYYPDKLAWQALQGSVLDAAFMQGLGKFDIVYSWGVLHHTGSMWQAIDNAANAVSDGGSLLIALYNDQGWLSDFWLVVKKTYCSGFLGKRVVQAIFFPVFFSYTLVQDLKNWQKPFSYIKNYSQNRGMSIVHDWNDWLGGYPFEVASPEAVISHLTARGFSLTGEITTKGLGCNEFLFAKD